MDLSKDNIYATLIFPTRGEGDGRETLLAQKVRKLIVKRRTGFGGSIDGRETPRACAKRELYDESGLMAYKKDFEFVGVMTFHNQREDGSEFVVRVYIFVLNKWKGELKPKKEEVRNLKWHRVNRLPFEKMPPSDVFWVPFIFAGKKIVGEAWHGPDQKTLLRTPVVKVVKSLSDIG